jgi:putative transposase
VPEVRRVILAIAAPEEERAFRLGWSLWRRAHQAIARRCHMARCTVREGASETSEKKKVEPSSVPVSTTTIILDRGRAKLAEEQWARLKPLLPENGHRGGQWREHRTVVEAILWVLVNGASWRELPEEFGPWQTAYQRYARWHNEGLWQRIVEMLRC